MRFTASASLGLALLLFGTSSLAQPPEQNQPQAQATSSPQTEEERKAAEEKATQEKAAREKAAREKAWSQFFFEEGLLRSCDDPTLKTAIALPQPMLNVEATDKGKLKLNARAGFKLKKSFVFDLEVESPKKDSEETTLATLDGLSNGTKADLKFSWFGWGPQNYTLAGIEEIWKKANAERLTKPAPPECGVDDKDPYCKMKTTISTSVGAKIADSRAADGDIRWSITDYSKPALERPSAMTILGQKEYEKAVGAYRDWLRYYDRFIPVVTVNANAEQKESKFFLPTAGPPAGLKETSEFHMNYLLTASTGAYLWGRFYSSLNYNRGTQYTDGAHQEFCTPTGAARILDCMSLPVAPPKKGKSEELAFEIRGLAGSLGLGAHVTRDLEAKITKIEIPVYLLQKLGTSKMELNLGARAQWRSDTKDIAVSVFLGPALSTVLRMFDRQ